MGWILPGHGSGALSKGVLARPTEERERALFEAQPYDHKV
jgi:hypothetical protein